MNRIYHITALSCLVSAGLSFAMDKKEAKPLKLSLLSTINDAIFFDTHRMIITGTGGTVWYMPEDKYEEKISSDNSNRILIRPQRDQVAIYGGTKCILCDLNTKKSHEIERTYAHRSAAFNCEGTHFFVYDTGQFIEIGGRDREDTHTGRQLLSIDCKNYERCIYPIECEGASSVGAMICHPSKDEIAYTSGKNVVSIVSIKNKLVEKKCSIAVDDIFGYVGGTLRYSRDGSHLGMTICRAIEGSGLSWHMYDFEKQELSDCGQCHAVDFHPNGLIMALLRRNTTVDFIDFRTKEIIASTEQLDQDPLFENCSESMKISLDGKYVFVAIPIGRPFRDAKKEGFLIPVPVAVYAYNKVKAERK